VDKITRGSRKARVVQKLPYSLWIITKSVLIFAGLVFWNATGIPVVTSPEIYH